MVTRAGRRIVSPRLFGRDRELAALAAAREAAARGDGSAVLLEGEPGVGKTRLARAVADDATAAGMLTLVGRTSQQAPTPYRPLTEALFPLARRRGLSEDPRLRPLRSALGRVVPDWRVDGAATDDPAVVVAEAVLRLVRIAAPPSGALLVVDDIHWADPETLAVVEYLADNVREEPIVLLLTARREPGGPPLTFATLDALEVRGAVTTLPLGRLHAADVSQMIRACAGEDIAPDLAATVAERSDGLPLLVEELLTVGSDVPGAAALPVTFTEAVQRRVATLDAPARLVLQCAAVLGRRFDWRLLQVIAHVDAATVLGSLEAAVAQQLVDADDGATWFRFHHALTREVVLAGLLGPTRAALAARAAAAVDAQQGDDSVALAAELWMLAGEPERAAARLLEAGRIAARAGALATARARLQTAMSLPSLPASVRADVGEALAEACALAAAMEEAVAVGEPTLELLERIDAAPDAALRRARLHLVLARAAVGATRWDVAAKHVDIAATIATEIVDERLDANVRSLQAQVAMGELRLEDAFESAATAREAAERLDLPDVRCESLEIIGRCERLRDLGAAERAFAEAHAVATAAGLRLPAIRALHELGTIDMFRTSSPARLVEARDLAAASGALSLAATVDLQLLGLYAFRFELDEAVALGESLIERTVRLGAPELHTAALLQLGFAYALAQRAQEMERVVEQATASGGTHPEAVALAWGHVRATASLFGEDRDAAVSQLRRAVEVAHAARAVPGVFPALWALVAVVEGADGDVVEEVKRLDAQSVPINRSMVAFAEAVLAWRRGDDHRAEELFSAADAVLVERALPGFRHLARRLAAEAAVREGFGDPAHWLREAMDFFAGTGHGRLVAACAALLREAGAPVPKLRARHGVPAELRSRGVTARELEVLDLVRQELTNQEIADRLFLSARTVEKHVERLLQKTGARTRRELARHVRGMTAADT